ncbi:hypothetical protein OSB04_021905 [Centaurea solstitialis]|uniref:Cation-transporting P-type ATPase N-terminal domain-containing protein n=1 Tax=Centaurea solstitialis TaxID=347529 RepID=A0AA38W759_9ASTR|nr:hypothetical protein OSB04_021905 [Centaurea solstitialis]
MSLLMKVLPIFWDAHEAEEHKNRCVLEAMAEEKPEVLEAVLKVTVDLESIPIEEVFENLRCSKEGLTTSAAQERLASKFLKFLGFMWNPLSWVMEAAALMGIALANGGGKPPDWQDFGGIIILLFINSAISFVEENNAGNAEAALMARLAPKAKVFNPEILLTTLC